MISHSLIICIIPIQNSWVDVHVKKLNHWFTILVDFPLFKGVPWPHSKPGDSHLTHKIQMWVTLFQKLVVLMFKNFWEFFKCICMHAYKAKELVGHFKKWNVFMCKHFFSKCFASFLLFPYEIQHVSNEYLLSSEGKKF